MSASPQTDASHAERGTLITFEGDDGVGKTTHINFLADALEAHGAEVISLREPGGTVVGEELRDLVLDPSHENMVPEAELLIYEAARAQIVAEVIEPALERGAVVLCDRFADSSVAYQAYGRGLDREFVDAANAFATRGIVPDRTFLMTCGEVRDGLAHIIEEEDPDRLELAGTDFHDRVRAGFEVLAVEQPDRIVRIDASGERSETAATIFASLTDLFPWMGDALVYDEAFFVQLDEAHAARVAMRKALAEAEAEAGTGAGGAGEARSSQAGSASHARREESHG